jgi:hypothetical protein
MKFFAALLIVPFATSAVLAQPVIFPANDLAPGCRAAANGFPSGANSANFVLGALCTGIVAGVLPTAPYLNEPVRFCPTNGVTGQQGLKVLIKFLDRYPERLHQPIAVLAIDAFHEAWPCQKAN